LPRASLGINIVEARVRDAAVLSTAHQNQKSKVAGAVHTVIFFRSSISPGKICGFSTLWTEAACARGGQRFG